MLLLRSLWLSIREEVAIYMYIYANSFVAPFHEFNWFR